MENVDVTGRHNHRFIVNWITYIYKYDYQIRGLLEEISIKHATGDLLKYIADGASHLRGLQLEQCYCILVKGMSEVSKKLSLKFIGLCYPLLKLPVFSRPCGNLLSNSE